MYSVVRRRWLKRSQGILQYLMLIYPLLFAAMVLHSQASPNPCNRDAGFHKLDFWLGKWDVLDSDGMKQGTNDIHPVLNGCAIVENWQGLGGDTGKSWFYFNPHTQIWRQVSVTTQPTDPGGIREKELIEEFDNGGLRFLGKIDVDARRTVLDRTTLTPLPDGRVRQVIEWSSDDGQNWNIAFDAFYVRQPAD